MIRAARCRRTGGTASRRARAAERPRGAARATRRGGPTEWGVTEWGATKWGATEWGPADRGSSGRGSRGEGPRSGGPRGGGLVAAVGAARLWALPAPGSGRCGSSAPAASARSSRRRASSAGPAGERGGAGPGRWGRCGGGGRGSAGRRVTVAVDECVQRGLQVQMHALDPVGEFLVGEAVAVARGHEEALGENRGGPAGDAVEGPSRHGPPREHGLERLAVQLSLPGPRQRRAAAWTCPDTRAARRRTAVPRSPSAAASRTAMRKHIRSR